MSLDLIILGKNIQKERTKKKKTQEELAFEVGISRNYLSLIETGRREVTLTFLIEIADNLECTTDKLLIGCQEHDITSCTEELEKLLKDCTPTEKRIVVDLCENLINSLIAYRKETIDL